MTTTTYARGLACGLFLLAGVVACDDLFISDGELARRLDLDGDGVENALDCAPLIAEVTRVTFWRDLDGDGWGAGEPITGCPDNGDFAAPAKEGFAVKNGDCNEGNDTVYPGAQEVCNLVDDNCNDVVDEGFVSTWCRDADQDRHGDPNDTRSDCGVPNGYVSVAECSDCDDTPDSGASVHPGAEELCDDGLDNDCDGLVDNAEVATLWCRDADNDGAGDGADAFYSCEEQEGYVVVCSDCNDGNPNIGPGVAEACEDSVDNDCDGVTDTDAVDVAWYADTDGDGFGDATVAQSACAPPVGFVGNALDCDDTSDAVKPGVVEVCNNGLDDNCDGSPNECVMTGNHTTAEADITISDAGGGAMTAIDLNNDGIDDLAAAGGGGVRVFFGPMQAGTIEAASAQVTINDAGGAMTVIDLNNDGVDDLAATSEGGVRVFFGPMQAGTIEVAAAQVTITGAGGAMTAIDLNNDGVDDLAASGGGAVHVFFGPMQAGTVEVATAQVTINGAGGGAMTGIDINNDGADDLVASGGNAVRVFFGPMQAGTVEAAAAQVTINGQNANDQFGSSIIGLEDFNGDGINDLAVGARAAANTQIDNGKVYLFLGPIAPKNMVANESHASWSGAMLGNWLGTDITTGEINNDNLSDIFVGARQGETAAGTVGCVYLIPGALVPTNSTSNLLVGSWCGKDEGEYASILPTHLPDLNDDNIDDIVLGATGTQKLHVFFGIGL